MRTERLSRFQYVATALSWALLLVPTAGGACEACKDAVQNDPVGTALSATTLVLIGMPMVLIGSIGGWIGYTYWRASRHATAERASDIASQPV